MKKIKHLLTILLLLFIASIYADNKPDSLYNLLSKKIHDTTRINIYNELCWPVYSFSNIDSSIKYGNKAIDLSVKTHDTLKLVIAYRRLGIAYINKADYKNALYYEKLSYDLAIKINNKKAIASALNNFSVIYLNMSDYLQAINYSIQTRKLYEELGDSINLFQIYYNLGILFRNIKEYAKANENYNKSLLIATLQGKKSQKSFALSAKAGLMVKQLKYDSALIYYNMSTALFEEDNNIYGLIENNINIGNLYFVKHDYKHAICYFIKGKKYNKQYNNQSSECNILGNLAASYHNLKKFDSAIYFGNQSYILSKKINDLGELTFVTKVLSDVYHSKNDEKTAFKYLNEFLTLNDSLLNNEKEKEITQKQMRFEFEKKVIADSLKVNEEKKITQEKLKHEATIRYSLFFFIILLVIFSFFMFNRFKIIKNQKQIIEVQKNKVDEKQKEILDSINYAKRIQSTILDNQLVMKEIFPDHFIYFKPKDIVSGDFYWAHRKSDYYYLAVCDSTGHGVPGAFMSLLNIGFLNEAINDNGIEKPNEIFDYVRNRLITSVSKEEQKDGFDGILICINVITKEITYAAANNKPILISNNQIIEQKVDKMPVGKGERQEAFNLHHLNAKSGDVLYLYTDGYADQFGGPKGKKFKYRPLNELLLVNSNFDMSKQLDVLSKEFTSWRGDLEQVDDVCVMGIKL